MSASRAIASAKNKKAGGNTPNPAAPQTPPSTPMRPGAAQQAAYSMQQSNSSQSVSKITIPQAIQLMDNRLNNLEGFMDNTSNVIQDIKTFNQDTENKYIVDSDVFNSLVARIEALEESHKLFVGPGGSIPKPVLKRESNLENHNLKINTDEMNELKNSFIRLQTYVMETNAKLSDIIFANSGESIVEFKDIFNKSDDNSLSITMNHDNNDESNMSILSPPTLQRGITQHLTDDEVTNILTKNSENENITLETTSTENKKEEDNETDEMIESPP